MLMHSYLKAQLNISTMKVCFYLISQSTAPLFSYGTKFPPSRFESQFVTEGCQISAVTRTEVRDVIISDTVIGYLGQNSSSRCC